MHDYGGKSYGNDWIELENKMAGGNPQWPK